jgi:hypothetical protein
LAGRTAPPIDYNLFYASLFKCLPVSELVSDDVHLKSAERKLSWRAAAF